MPFLHQYRPDVVIIWPHMASTSMSLAHTTYTSHMCLHRAEKPYKFYCKWLKTTILVAGQVSNVHVEIEQICFLASVQNFEEILLLAQKLPKWCSIF